MHTIHTMHTMHTIHTLPQAPGLKSQDAHKDTVPARLRYVLHTAREAMEPQKRPSL